VNFYRFDKKLYATHTLTPTNRTKLPRPHFWKICIYIYRSCKFLSICQKDIYHALKPPKTDATTFLKNCSKFFHKLMSFVNFHRFAKIRFATPTLTPTNFQKLPRPHFSKMFLYFYYVNSKFLSICHKTFYNAHTNALQPPKTDTTTFLKKLLDIFS